MAVLSIVVPVYRVPGYLKACLDSIFTGAEELVSAATVEVIAVDDASPDECAQLLDEYAITLQSRGRPGDAPRSQPLRVLHLAENVGLGPARNAGLDAADGSYVWFVDSDDWLEPGAVAAVVAALEQTKPDLLLIDHDRVYDSTGVVERDKHSELLRGVPADQVFAIDERPALLRVQHTAWSRVFRRAYLAEQGLRFPPGWYEDFAMVHPAVLAAERVSVLDRVCYHYRQRDQGAITKTPSPRIFEVFDQYDRMQATLDRMAEPGAPAAQRVRRFRPLLFQLMIAHHLVILGNEGRVPPSLRREYFRRTVEQYRRYRPDGYAAPPGAAGLRQRLVAANAYPAWAGLRWAYRSAKGLRRAVTGRVA